MYIYPFIVSPVVCHRTAPCCIVCFWFYFVHLTARLCSSSGCLQFVIILVEWFLRILLCLISNGHDRPTSPRELRGDWIKGTWNSKGTPKFLGFPCRTKEVLAKHIISGVTLAVSILYVLVTPSFVRRVFDRLFCVEIGNMKSCLNDEMQIIDDMYLVPSSPF